MFNKLIHMEQILDISWFTANMVTLYIGLKAKLVLLALFFTDCTMTNIHNTITIIGGISSLIFTVYISCKLWHQIMINKELRKTIKKNKK